MRYEGEFSKLLFNNAIVFLDEAVGFINGGIDIRKNMILAIINIQIAIELALKSSIVEYFGIRKVLVNNQATLTDVEIENLYRNNGLKLREYESLKNFTKSKEADIGLYDFEKEQYDYMKRFQEYRNRIFHSAYIFTKEEIETIEKDLIYVLIHVIGVLMSDRRDEEYRRFMQEYLNQKEYSILMKNPLFNKELLNFLKKEYDLTYTCPICGWKTLLPHKFCARCLIDYNESSYAFVKCGYCKEKMVICDAANIEYNGNMLRGLCLNCGEDTMVYKCTKCHRFINLELFDDEDCLVDFCKLYD